MSDSANVRFVRWWLGIMFVVTLAVGPLAVFTFGAVSFTTLAWLWLRDRDIPPEQCECHRVSGAILGLSALGFVLNLAIEFLERSPSPRHPELFLLLMALAFLFPPLMIHMEYLDQRSLGIHSAVAGILKRSYYPISILLIIATLLLPLGFYRAKANSVVLLLQAAMFTEFVLAVAVGMRKTGARLEVGRRRMKDLLEALAGGTGPDR